MILLVAFAFLAGIITVLSPCILPILPIILTSSIGEVKIGLSRPFGVVLGFVLSFTFFTLFLSTLVRVSGIPADVLRLVSVFVIATLGASLLIPNFQLLVERLFSKLAKFMPQSQNKTGFGGGLVIGFSVGLLWTPCVGPILASVISLAITGTVTFDAFLITLAYSLGTAIPMFLIILGGQNALRRVPWLTANLGKIQKIFGVLMILTAMAIYLNLDRKFQTFVLETFPQYGVGLTKFEDNEAIKKQLSGMGDESEGQESANVKSNSLNPKAPEIIPGGVWFNLPAGRQGSEPLTIESLKGKVVLVDFWTYTCINCQRTFPYLKDWNEKYKDMGFVIIGVHSPEFEFEKSAKNVQKAIEDFGLAYPVVQDNNFETWKNYKNRFWPAKYLIDANGKIRYTHFGEGNYDVTEKNIQDLIREAGQNVDLEIKKNESSESLKFGERPTAETYLGHARANSFEGGQYLAGASTYLLDREPSSNKFSLGGSWMVDEEYVESRGASKLSLNFNAKTVHLVITPKITGDRVRVMLDGKFYKEIILDSDRLYDLVELESFGRHTLELEFLGIGTRIFAFTFGV